MASFYRASNFSMPLNQQSETRTHSARKYPSFVSVVSYSFLAICCCFVFSETALSQVAVQLPRTRVFQSNSSYFVPDGGTTFGGGISRSAEGLTSRGTIGNTIPGLGRLFGNRAYGRSTTSGGISTSAQILILKEREEGLLNGTLDRFGRPTIPYRNSSVLPGQYGYTDLYTPSYSWAKRFSLESQQPTNRLSKTSNTSPYATKGSAFGSKSSSSRASALQQALSSSKSDSLLPSNREIRSRAEFLKKHIGRSRGK